MLPVNVEALQWLRVIRLTLISRKVPASETIRYPLIADGLRLAQRAKPGIHGLDNSPHEMITRELASASRAAIRFLRKRGVRRAEREDILHDAILWCLENRDNYSLTTTLETWFFNAVRDAYKRVQRYQARVIYYSEVKAHGTVQDDD